MVMAKEDEVRKAFDEGLQLLARQKEERSKVRVLSKESYGELKDAHWIAMSVIANSTSRVSGQPGDTSADLSQLLSLSASFVQGIDICETAISEGLYVQAAALLKQEMETVAAIQEIRDEKRKSLATPNVKYLGELAVLYGDLNRAAHVADENLMQEVVRLEIDEKRIGAPLFPIFNEGLAKLFYGLHVVLITMIALEIHRILCEMYGAGLDEAENDMLARVAQIIQKEGWLPRTAEDSATSVSDSR